MNSNQKMSKIRQLEENKRWLLGKMATTPNSGMPDVIMEFNRRKMMLQSEPELRSVIGLVFYLLLIYFLAYYWDKLGRRGARCNATGGVERK